MEHLIKDTKSFIQKSKEVYGDLFEYDKTNYITWKTPLILKCKHCGQYFEMTPAKHLGVLKKRPKYGIIGCPECNMRHGLNIRRKNISDRWFSKAISKFGNCFDYSESKYIDNDIPIKILCKNCNNYFWQSPLEHLRKDRDCCPSCERSNNFIKKSIEIYGLERYDFTNVKYRNLETYVRIYDKLNNVDFLILPKDF